VTPVEKQRVLKSSNPVLSRPQFQRQGGRKTTARGPRAGIAVARERIRAGKDVEQAYEDGLSALPFSVGDLMTMDDVRDRDRDRDRDRSIDRLLVVAGQDVGDGA